MKSKKIIKTLSVMMLSVMVLSGVEGVVKPMNSFIAPQVAYAVDSQSTGLNTPTGIISGKIKYSDIPENKTLEQLKSISVSVDPKKNPELFLLNPTLNSYSFNIQNMNLTDKIYHYSFYDEKFGEQIDGFFKVLSMEKGSSAGKVNKYSTIVGFIDGVAFSSNRNIKNEIVDNDAYNYLVSESKEPTDPVKPPTTPTEPTKKTYSATRLGGANRWETSIAIAKKVNGSKLDAVVLANAYNFPDALTSTTLAGQKNAPILLIGNNENDIKTLNYLKANLKSTGTVYVVGGNGVITDSTVSKIKNIGFKNIKRLGGSDRYATNMSIVNELNVPKGSNIVIANSHSYADSLSISGVAGGTNMPIFLVNDSLTSSVINKIKSIAPKNIFIVGDTGVVSSSVENQLKSYGNVVRLGGKDRFATSLKVANYFTGTSQTTAAIAYSHDFPDALTGGVLASKTSSPVLLVRGDASAQKVFLDKTSINNLYILGGTGVINDATVKQLSK